MIELDPSLNEYSDEDLRIELDLRRASRPEPERIPVVRERVRSDNRRAAITLWPDELRQLLNLPDGYVVEQIYAVWDPASIRIVVGSPELDPAPHDTYLPDLPGGFNRLRYVDPDGVAWTRWEWQPA